VDKKISKSTSINVNADLWKKAKMKAIERGMTVTQLVETAIKKEIEEH
jgi:post-segregation antitoxin (ccd killing protein)